jgi:biotin carboxyl carrier protein
MRYFVTLNGREFPLRHERSPTGSQLWADPVASTSPASSPSPSGAARPERPLSAQLLRPARHGRPALVQVEGRAFRVLVQRETGSAERGGSSGRVRVEGEALRLQLETELQRRVRPAASAAHAQGTRVAAPMPGRVVKVSVNVGDRVEAGTPLLSVEAMKMENELQAPSAGVVVSIGVRVGSTVESDQELVLIAPESRVV